MRRDQIPEALKPPRPNGHSLPRPAMSTPSFLFPEKMLDAGRHVWLQVHEMCQVATREQFLEEEIEHVARLCVDLGPNISNLVGESIGAVSTRPPGVAFLRAG